MSSRTLVLIGCLLCASQRASAQLYKDRTTPLEQRVSDLLSRMTLEEKLDYIGGQSPIFIRAIPRLGIPQIKMSDGPVGVRSWGPSTAYPAGILSAATWDTALVNRLGHALGRDARARGVHILLAPGVNLHRAPMNGRNFEYFGEDPYLAARMAVNYITGVQAESVIAVVKHFAANNQEWDRHRISSDIDERTLQELYLPAFRAAVQDAHVGAVMNSYNLVNGVHAAESTHLLTDVLKHAWHFDGFVMSDWFSTSNGVASANAGLDLEMPFGRTMNQQVLLPALQRGEVTSEMIDDKVRRILRVLIRFGFLDRPQTDSTIARDDSANAALSLEVARSGMVLLKNDHTLLPLDPSKIKTIAVIGPNADTYAAGAGSSYVTPFHTTTVLQGIRALVGPGAKVVFVPGVQRGKAPDFAAAAAAAKSADVVIVCVGFNGGLEAQAAGATNDGPAPGGVITEGEGHDRPFELPDAQDSLILAVARANPRTIVTLNAGGNVAMQSWLPHVKGLLDSWYGGQDGGRAVAEILFGRVNPSGKLPVSFEKAWTDNPVSKSYYDDDHDGRVIYAEGLALGYRYYDTASVQPQFPFGYGLSYTTFTYGHIIVQQLAQSGTQGPKVSVRFDVTNTGKRAGAEVAQVYVHPINPPVPRPYKELKGFAKVFLKPGETRHVTVTLDASAFAYYSPKAGDFVAPEGVFDILVGASSKDSRLTAKFKGSYPMGQLNGLTLLPNSTTYHVPTH